MAKKSIRAQAKALDRRQTELQKKVAETRIGIGRLEAKVSRKEGPARGISNKQALAFGKKSATSLIEGTRQKNKAKKRLADGSSEGHRLTGINQ